MLILTFWVLVLTAENPMFDPNVKPVSLETHFARFDTKEDCENFASRILASRDMTNDLLKRRHRMEFPADAIITHECKSKDGAR